LATNRWKKWIRDFGPRKLARKLEISPSAVYQWLMGQTNPKTDHMRKIIKISRGELGPGDFI
jgi:DNA-binding transcriptional regulator YdaS (Cro superfamily)